MVRWRLGTVYGGKKEEKPVTPAGYVSDRPSALQPTRGGEKPAWHGGRIDRGSRGLLRAQHSIVCSLYHIAARLARTAQTHTPFVRSPPARFLRRSASCVSCSPLPALHPDTRPRQTPLASLSDNSTSVRSVSIKKDKMAIEVQQIIEIILCIFLPPLAIFIHGNDCNIHIVISIILCFLFWLPAILHALWYCFFRG